MILDFKQENEPIVRDTNMLTFYDKGNHNHSSRENIATETSPINRNAVMMKHKSDACTPVLQADKIKDLKVSQQNESISSNPNLT